MSKKEAPIFRPSSSRRKAVAVIAGVSTALAAGVYSQASNGPELPGCEVEVQPGDTVGGVVKEINSNGGDAHSADVSGFDSKHEPITPENHPERAGANGNVVLHPGDKLGIPDVDPKICVQIGGTVLKKQ